MTEAPHFLHFEGAHARNQPLTLDRLMSRITKDSETGCWNWTGAHSGRGYGKIYQRIERRNKGFFTHRLVYERIVGPIPEGLELDHLCRNPRCANPAHLEPVTHRTNMLRGNGPAARAARQTHCIRGHELSGDNVKLRGVHGQRRCLACAKEYNRAAYARVKASR